VSPHAWEPEVATLAADLGVADSVTLASTDELAVGGEGDPRALTARLWPVAELAARYQAFVDTHAFVPAYLEGLRARRGHMADEAFASGALTVTVQFQAVFNDDPLLPPELLPRPWPGRAARDLLVRSRRLALRLRSAHDRPALFRAFDELISSMP
jgi:phenylacetic acid degradation operon negative regulatory protein